MSMAFHTTEPSSATLYRAAAGNLLTSGAGRIDGYEPYIQSVQPMFFPFSAGVTAGKRVPYRLFTSHGSHSLGFGAG